MSPGPPMWNTYIAVDDADATAATAPAAGGKVFADPFDVFDSGGWPWWPTRRGRPQPLAGGSPPRRGHRERAGSLSWNELITRDPDGARRFYGEVFGWRTSSMDYAGTQYTVWHLAGEGEPEPRTGIGGMMPMVGEQWPADLPSHWMAYFAVEDADSSASRSQELGGRVAVPPFDTPVGRTAVLNDPAGAPFSVIALSM